MRWTLVVPLLFQGPALLCRPALVSGQTPSVSAPAAPERVVEATLQNLPISVRYEGRPIAIRFPADAEVRARGGSGGLIVEIVAPRPGGGPDARFLVLAIGLAVVRSEGPWPAFEVWSRAGGGVFTRAVYSWQPLERQYCARRVDEFEDYGDSAERSGVVRIAGEQAIVRYARSRSWECESPEVP